MIRDLGDSPEEVLDPPNRSPRERRLARLKVAGAALIVLAVLTVAAIALLW